MAKVKKSHAQKHPGDDDKEEPTPPEVTPDEDEDEDEDDESPAVEVPPEVAPEEAPKEGTEGSTGEPESPPPAGSHKITIEGEGSFPLYLHGAMRRFERGTPIEVTDEELKALKDSDEKVKKA